MTPAFGGQYSIQLSYGCAGRRVAALNAQGQWDSSRGRRGRLAIWPLTLRYATWMNAHSSFSQPPGGLLPTSGRAEFGQASASAMSMKWSALHDAVGVVGMLAGLASEPMRPEVRNFPAVMRDVGGWRRERSELGIADLAAIMEPGMAALLAVHARGVNSAAPALALWQEFHALRAALLALVPPPGTASARRFM